MVGGPHAGDLDHVLSLLIGLVQFGGQVGGQLGVARVEVLEGRADRVAIHQAGEGALEGGQVLADAVPDEGVAPGALDMSDDRQGAALRVGQHARRQLAEEGARGDLALVLKAMRLKSSRRGVPAP